MHNIDLACEITNNIEKGVRYHMNKSIVYSPLKLFFGRFERHNPQTIANAREVVINDVRTVLFNIPNFNQAVFVDETGMLTSKGRALIHGCEKLGIYLLRKKLGVRTAFKVVTNQNYRAHAYEFILHNVQVMILKFIPQHIEENQ